MKNSKISAVIFDMDGLIIDSEPLWKIAEIETFKEVGFDFTIEMCALTTGMRIDEVVEFWRKKLKWQNFTNVEICLLYTSPSPRDGLLSRMPSSA